MQGLHPIPRELHDLPNAVSLMPQGLDIHIHAAQQITGRLGQTVVTVRVQIPGIPRRCIRGHQTVHSHCIQHAAQTAHMVPVEMGQQQDIQMADSMFFQKISRVNAPGTGVQLLSVVIPHQVVMATVHQHGKPLRPLLHLPYQDGITVANVDEIQYQHIPVPPARLLIIRYHSCPTAATKKRIRPFQKFLLNFVILTKIKVLFSMLEIPLSRALIFLIIVPSKTGRSP